MNLSRIKVHIGDICKINQASYSARDQWEFVNYLDTGNITENRISEIQYFDISSDAIPSRAKRKVMIDDIVYSTVRPNQRHYGIIKEMPKNMLVSTGFTVISVLKEKAYSDYIYYYLSQNEVIESIHAIAEQSASTYPSIKPADLENLELELPSITEQIIIADTLSAIERKMALNRRINDNLEKQSQLLFEQLFFINANHNWKEGKLSDIALINPTRTLKKGAESVYVEMANLPTSGSFPSNWDSKPFSGGMKFTNGDTIMARITPCLENGKTAYINFLNDGEVAFGSTEYIVISPKLGYCNEMFYFLARKKEFVNYAVGNMNGTSGRQRVTSEAIGNYELKIPAQDMIQEFASFAGPVMNIIKENSLENRILTQLRDLILPKLMSGEIDVSRINL